MADGYVRLWRSTLDWEWIDDLNTLKVWIYILLTANWKEGKFQGNDIPIGSFVRSLDNIASETHLTKSQVRTALNHLKNTGEISTQIARKSLLITVENWALYQSNENEELENLAPTSHANRTDIRKKESNKEEYININKSNTKYNSNIFVTPTLQEVQEYITSKGYSVDAETFFNYYEANGWKVGRNKMKSWKSTVAYWNSKSKPKEEFF